MANTMELEINGSVHIFKAGFAFIRKVEPLHKQKQNGVESNVGLNFLVAGLVDRDADALLDALNYMNEGDHNRLTRTALEEYIEEHEDIDGLFDQVLDFLQTANCTKSKVSNFMQKVEEIRKRQETEALGHGGNSTSNA